MAKTTIITPEQKTCPPHWWMIPEQRKDSKLTVTGTCKFCGAKKNFYKTTQLTAREIARVRSKIIYGT